ncbi:efflux RND transporter periplasmic adaptor subunit [Enterobacter sp. CC120223-11]|uniref:efflux RND transporter periplasmic adaptor subunit n=1 Tax=Enterobacter sp. CC120223-11 TaxID=1378073 RepID=UPI000BC4B542|nr:efflux RND transporter periplasmic adaptor subunit [Enterobacter sp. CC120223-11]SNY62600.1 RND family efflux transporter, MFP subunit [Enterobacter sp. CC120223-11]
MNKTLRHALLACGLAVCTLGTAMASAIPVRLVTVEQTSHAAERQIPGRIEAIHTVAIRARTEGVIEKMHFREGQYVNAGDLMFELDSASQRAALSLAQAEQKSAEASLRQAQQLLARYESLKNSQAISRNDVDTARMQRDVAAAAVEQAKARVQTQTIALSYTRITSPVTGRVGHTSMHQGSLINPASGVLVEVVQLDPVRIAFALDEQTFWQKSGQHVDISDLKAAWLPQIQLNGERASGTLTSVDNRIDPRTASVTLRAEFANPQHRLLPGGSVDIWLRPQEEQPTLMIPAAAVMQDASGFFAWAVDGNGLAQQKRLKLGAQQGQQFTVLDGLTSGERIVTEGAQRLRNGVAVQPLS